MNSSNKILFLKQLAKIIKADNKIVENETAFLLDISKLMNIEPNEIQDYLDLEKIVGTSKSNISKTEKINQIYRLILMMKIDGIVAKEEIELIKNISLEMGLSTQSINILFDKVVKQNKLLSDEELTAIFRIENN